MLIASRPNPGVKILLKFANANKAWMSIWGMISLVSKGLFSLIRSIRLIDETGNRSPITL